MSIVNVDWMNGSMNGWMSEWRMIMCVWVVVWMGGCVNKRIDTGEASRNNNMK